MQIQTINDPITAFLKRRWQRQFEGSYGAIGENWVLSSLFLTAAGVVAESTTLAGVGVFQGLADGIQAKWGDHGKSAAANFAQSTLSVTAGAFYLTNSSIMLMEGLQSGNPWNIGLGAVQTLTSLCVIGGYGLRMLQHSENWLAPTSWRRHFGENEKIAPKLLIPASGGSALSGGFRAIGGDYLAGALQITFAAIRYYGSTKLHLAKEEFAQRHAGR